MHKTNVLTQAEYDSLVFDGYTEYSFREMYHNAGVGRYVVLEKNAGICTRIQRAIGSVFCCPFYGFGHCLDECQGDTWDNFRRDFCTPVSRGVSQVSGYVEDREKTLTLYNEDFQKLVKENFCDVGATALANQKDWVPSSKCPSHCYVLIDGLELNFSYIVIIPGGKSKEAIAYATYNTQGKPCNGGENTLLAELLCWGYKARVGEITVVAHDLIEKECVASLMSHRVGIARVPSFPVWKVESVCKSAVATPIEEFEMLDE